MTSEVRSGVDVLARLLVLRAELDSRAGLATATMVSGYPGSPLGTFDLTLDSLGSALESHRIVHRPGLNEELAAAVVWGSQMGAVTGYSDGVDGVVGAWYGKGPGLDRAGDALKHANALGSGPSGGVVAFCGDDPASKSSTLACDSQYTFQDAAIPVLYPGDQQDVLDLGVHAFAMSRYAGCWVGMKIVTAVADGIGSVDFSLDRHVVVAPSGPWRHEPLARIGPHAVLQQESLVLDQRLAAAQEYALANGLDRVAGSGTRLGIVCAGKTFFDVTQALADLGVTDLDAAGLRILRLGMTYPLVSPTVADFAGAVEEVLVVEEKRPFVESQLRSILHEAGVFTPVRGKRDAAGAPLVPTTGELDAVAVASVLVKIGAIAPPGEANRPISARVLPMLPARAPGFCSGCPHNRSTVFPSDALVGGGVGCHGIMYFEARHAGMTALPPTPMGAEGVPWIGLAPFVDDEHLIQNLGDGTLSHSGTLAIRASVAAGVNVTFKILYNAAVAMTGGQDVVGLMSVPALTRALAAEGVSRIEVVSAEPRRYGRRPGWARGIRVHGRDALESVQDSLRSVPGTSVIIYDQQCAAEARRLRKRGLLPTPPARVVINEAVCEGCGDCGAKSNCMSVLPVQTEFGEKRQVHDPSCNRDYTCLEGDCPSFVTITPKRKSLVAKAKSAPVALPSGDLPLPVPAALDGQFGIYFTGIGGTGVVTANRVLAAAAESAGLYVGGLDQTGLSQKAGAVVSHLHLAASREELGASAVDHADLYLSGDLLQAASPKHLATVRPGRTVAVVDGTLTPTAAMLQGGADAPSASALQEAVVDAGPARTIVVDSQYIAETVFGNHLLANVVLLGAAFQAGGLPLSLADLEVALKKGRDAAANRDAFEWGRWVAHDPAAVEAALRGAAATERHSPSDPSAAAVTAAARLLPSGLPDVLVPLVTRRTAQVVDHQNTARGKRYLDLVSLAASRDSADREWALTRAVAESWFKLLAYKDEYEVARLHLATDYDAVARGLGIEGDYTVKYHLHPPALRRLGMRKKLVLGRPYAVAFGGLARLKRLRGTPLDPFGYDRDRRTERAVIDEYAALVRSMGNLPYERQVELAASALSIKGYAGIKERAVEDWRARVAELRGAKLASDQ